MSRRNVVADRRSFSRIRNLIICGIVFVACTVGWLYLANRNAHNFSVSQQSTTVPSLSVKQFRDESTKLDTLMRQHDLSAAFAYVTEQIAAHPSFAKSCHPLLHELGRRAYGFYGSYASAIQYQNEICDSGYTHGVIEAYLTNVPDIQTVLQVACPTSRESFTSWQCFHGLGHGIMLASNGQIDHSLILCKTLVGTFAQNACVNGVFMQHFVVTDHDGSVPATNPTSLQDCHYQDVIYQADCYSYAPSAYLTVYSGQYAAGFHWCERIHSNYVATCMLGIGSQAMKEHITDTSIVKAICQLTQTYTSDCIQGAVTMFAFFHGSSKDAQQLCTGAFDDYRSACMQALQGVHAAFHI